MDYIPTSLSFEMGVEAAKEGVDIEDVPFDREDTACDYHDWRRGYAFAIEEGLTE